jgi:DNA polymerase/3'-5' exonuclease PolX
MIRTIFEALLYEFSLVTVPAYKEATVQTDGAGAVTVEEIDGMDQAQLVALAESLNITSPGTMDPDALRAAVKAALGFGEKRSSLILPNDPSAGLWRTINRWRA